MIEIIRSGVQSLVVDVGRPGYRHAGVASAGALDVHAYRIGNERAGNEAGDAAVEIAYGSFECRFLRTGTFALAGAVCGARLNGEPFDVSVACDAREGDRLRLGAVQRGVRTYLALSGGVDVPRVLGSRSTDLRAGFGGLEGRALQSGDVLRAGIHAGTNLRRVDDETRDWRAITVRAVSHGAPREFWSREWIVRHESNRMGCRLAGEPLTGGGDVDSCAVFPGVVQLPQNGEPIVLLADAQTLGGYAPIAVVPAEELPVFGQLAAGARVRFSE